MCVSTGRNSLASLFKAHLSVEGPFGSFMVRRTSRPRLRKFKPAEKFSLQGTDRPPLKDLSKMVFLFPRWDVLLPGRVTHPRCICWPGECELLQFCLGNIEKLGHVLGIDSSKFNMGFLTLKIEIWEKGRFSRLQLWSFLIPHLWFYGMAMGIKPYWVFFFPGCFSKLALFSWWCCWENQPKSRRSHPQQMASTN